MKKCLMIAACLGFLLLAGCNRCGMWDWYKPCDLIEGRAARQCGPCVKPCDPCHQPGQVVRREIAVKASDCMPPAPPAQPEATVIVVEEMVVDEAAPPAN